MFKGFRIPPPDGRSTEEKIVGGSVSKLSHGVNHIPSRIHSRFGTTRAEYAGRTGTSLRTTVAPGAGQRFLRCRFRWTFAQSACRGSGTQVLRLVRIGRIPEEPQLRSEGGPTLSGRSHRRDCSLTGSVTLYYCISTHTRGTRCSCMSMRTARSRSAGNWRNSLSILSRVAVSRGSRRCPASASSPAFWRSMRIRSLGSSRT